MSDKDDRETPPGPPEPADDPLSFKPRPAPEGERWAHRLDPDLAAEREGGKRAADIPAPARPGGSRYGWLVGVAALLALAYIGLNSIRTEGTGPLGIEAGRQLPPFAVPLAPSRLEGDANIAARAGDGAEGSRPACEVRGPQVLNICELGERSPVVLAFFARRAGKECERELDVIDSVRPRFPGVAFVAVSIRGDRDELRKLVQRRRWGFPIGFDRDGAVANLYGVAVCPAITFAYPGRSAMDNSLGFLDRNELSARVKKLVDGSRRRGWRPPA